MKIAVNTRLLLKNRLEGIGWFTYETLQRITRSHPEIEFYFLFDRPYDPEFIFSDNITPLVVPPQARHPVLFIAWFEFSIPGILKKIKPDLFFSPDGYLSLSTSVKSLSVMHDLNFKHYPHDLPFLVRKYYNYYFPRFANKAERIATVSNYSKQDIMDQYHIPAEKIDVVYNGANELYKPADEKEKKSTREKYTGGAPYFIFVGALHPRKNLVNLFAAFDMFRQKNKCDIKLVIAGARQWWTREIKSAYEQMLHKTEVIFVGRQPINELKSLLASATALAYVSYFEGFGIPIIEAFRCNTPVITSSVTSMPEVAGGAAHIVDPFSAEDISKGLEIIAFDTPYRENLIKKGRERSKIFTWDSSANRLWKSIEKCIY